VSGYAYLAGVAGAPLGSLPGKALASSGGPIRFSLPPRADPRDRAASELNRTAAFRPKRLLRQSGGFEGSFCWPGPEAVA
jgi:hypothetical protein